MTTSVTQHGSIVVTEAEPGTSLTWEQICTAVVSVFGMKVDTVVQTEDAYIAYIDQESSVSISELLLMVKEAKTWAIELVVDYELQRSELRIYRLDEEHR